MDFQAYIAPVVVIHSPAEGDQRIVFVDRVAEICVFGERVYCAFVSVSIAGAFQFQESFTVVQDDKGCFAKVLLLIVRVVEMDSTDGRSFSVEAAFICCMCPVIAVPAVNGISGGERGITAAAVDF